MMSQSNADRKDPTHSYPLHKIRVLLLESVAQSAVDHLVKAGYTVETCHKLTQKDLKNRIENVHAIGIRSKTNLSAEILDHAKKLLVIGHFCIGTDQTNLGYSANKGIPVFNSPFANTRSVAELVAAEMIMLARQAGDRSMEMHRGIWNKVSKNCHEIRGKILGIIGYGHVGQQLSVICEALGMSIRYFDIVPKMSIGNAHSTDSLEELLRISDFVTLHVPLTEETENMIGTKQINLMKENSYLINASRGPVVVLEAVEKNLKSGHLSGCAFDVYPSEPSGKADDYHNSLMNCPNTILTPHIGGSTEEAQTQIGIETAQKIIDFINQGITLGSVNFPNLTLPPNDEKTHRIINVHQDKPGVLKKINDILGNYNISSQVLGTKNGVGYIMVELESAISHQVKKQIQQLDESIKTRIIF